MEVKIKNIIVYTKPRCSHCEATKAWLEKNAQPEQWETQPIDENILGYAKKHGFKSAPIVINTQTNDGHCGFNIEKLKEYVQPQSRQ